MKMINYYKINYNVTNYIVTCNEDFLFKTPDNMVETVISNMKNHQIDKIHMTELFYEQHHEILEAMNRARIGFIIEDSKPKSCVRFMTKMVRADMLNRGDIIWMPEHDRMFKVDYVKENSAGVRVDFTKDPGTTYFFWQEQPIDYEYEVVIQ